MSLFFSQKDTQYPVELRGKKQKVFLKERRVGQKAWKPKQSLTLDGCCIVLLCGSDEICKQAARLQDISAFHGRQRQVRFN